MRCLLALALLFGSTTAASAHWRRSWHYHYHPAHYWAYPGPVVYGSYWYAPTVVYWDPVWVYPASWCVCPPVLQPVASPPAAAPPKSMDAERTQRETPFSPIAPATMSTPEEKPPARIPPAELPQPMPRVEELPKPEFAPIKPAEPAIEAPRIEAPQPRKDPPKIELPPLEPPVLNSKSVSHYLGAPEVSLFPVAGLAPANGSYRIGFFNATERNITLVVNGETLELPRQSRVSATVARSFRWSVDGEAERSTIINADAAGMDVLIR